MEIDLDSYFLVNEEKEKIREILTLATLLEYDINYIEDYRFAIFFKKHDRKIYSWFYLKDGRIDKVFFKYFIGFDLKISCEYLDYKIAIKEIIECL